jgi:hypothetical protein
MYPIISQKPNKSWRKKISISMSILPVPPSPTISDLNLCLSGNQWSVGSAKAYNTKPTNQIKIRIYGEWKEKMEEGVGNEGYVRFFTYGKKK